LEDLLKSTFDQNQPNTCTISEEVEFLNKYLEIEKARFKNRLDVMFEIEPDTESIKIPCYLVQPLVENSIKHAVGKMLSKCTIKISAFLESDNLRLDILDTGSNQNKKTALTWGVGLKNIDERLKLFYGPDALLQIGYRQEGGFQSSVIIPKKYLL
jgi:LytS/YehU family sensor histidine kinase